MFLKKVLKFFIKRIIFVVNGVINSYMFGSYFMARVESEFY